MSKPLLQSQARARELRLQGWSYDQIQAELGCSKSSVSLWVRDLPKPAPRYTQEEHMKLMSEGLRRSRDERRQAGREVVRMAKEAVGELSDRELHFTGVALYWAEGAKAKDRPSGTRGIQFINSDPNVILVFLRWLELMDVEPERLRLRVSIHETADVAAAEEFWSDLTGVDRALFARVTLKRHNPKTNRKNTGEDYHGCLTVYVMKSADLYRRMEGTWYGIVGATQNGLT